MSPELRVSPWSAGLGEGVGPVWVGEDVLDHQGADEHEHRLQDPQAATRQSARPSPDTAFTSFGRSRVATLEQAFQRSCPRAAPAAPQTLLT